MTPGSDRPAKGGYARWQLAWILTLVVFAGLLILYTRGRLAPSFLAGADRPSPLPLYGEVPEFQLTERSGKTISRADLSGVIWVADFIFTRCPGICPLLSTRMAALQQKLQGTEGRPVRFVSFSVDPEWDTPDRLREYAVRYQADPARWLFLTGPPQAMARLITGGFRLSVATAPAGSREPIVHSDRFVLVDSSAQIRGYYHGSEQADLDRLVRDLGGLRRE